MSSKDKDYEIGYQKPPKANQFQPGRSGNPKGRQTSKPTKRNFDTDFRNEFDEIITIQEGGKSKQVTKQQALIKRLFAIALTGNSTAIKTVTEILNKMPIKDSDMLLNEALTVVKGHLDKARAEKKLPAEIDAIYNPSDLLPIPILKPRTW